MDPLSQVFCLRWNNHRNNLLTVLDHLLQTEAFCDVTLACDNTSIKCHKMILSACSTYFQTLFMENSCEHPIVFLKDIKYGEIRAILDYMYKGEVNVAQEELPGLLKVAELLRVKGLVEDEREKLLNTPFGKDSRNHVTTSSTDPSSSTSGSGRPKVNGGDPGPRSDDRRSSLISDKERDKEHHSGGGGLKDSPVGVGPPRPFMLTPPPGAPSFPMIPFPGMLPGMGHLFGAGGGARERDREAGGLRRGGVDEGDSSNEREGSPSPGSGANKRRKVASGSGGSSSSKESGLGSGHREEQQALAMDVGRGDPGDREDKGGLHHDLDKDGMLGLPPGLDKSGIANYVPNQRLEWKRYKQYTRNDIMQAIEEVKSGMSALQASRKYGVPSRTLYDKVKKMGITTGRQIQRKSLPQYPSQFPAPLGVSMLNMSDSYKDIAEREDTNDSSLGAPGDAMDGRATMVPPTGLSTLHMLNIMKGMKESECSKGDSEISLRPMNLSTMLGAERGKQRQSESSLSPRSPRPHHRDLDDDIVDSSGPGAARQRHSSGGSNEAIDIRAQFMADLRRLGHIPTQSTSAGDNHNHHAATSTTHSSPPPPPRGESHGAGTSPAKSASADSENNLPPRKRKVSQEHHSAAGSAVLLPGRPASPYNGIHDQAETSSPGEESPPTNNPPSVNPPKKPDEPPSPSVECRN